MDHFLNGTEPGVNGICDLALRALELRAGAATQNFHGMRISAIFLKPSLRARTSLEAAASALSVHPITLVPGRDAWPIELRDGAIMDGDKVEHVADAIRVLSTYTDLIALRSSASLDDATLDRAEPMLSAVTKYAGVPILNLKSSRWHPLRGLTDTATWMSRLGPDLRGQPITISWAPHPLGLSNAIPNQVLAAAAMQGMDVTLAHPPGFDLDPEVVAGARESAQTAGGRLEVTNNQAESLRGARVVMSKSWAGFSFYGRREEEAAIRADLGHWRMDDNKLASTDNAGFMHPLPIRRNVVATDSVMNGPQSWVYEQAAMRLYTTMAVLEQMLGGEKWAPAG